MPQLIRCLDNNKKERSSFLKKRSKRLLFSPFAWPTQTWEFCVARGLASVLLLPLLSGCTLFNTPNDFSPVEIPNGSLSAEADGKTLLAVTTNGPVFFENFDPSANRVPHWCPSYINFGIWPVKRREELPAPSKLVIFSVPAGSYIFSVDGSFLPHTSPSERRSFTIRAGQRIYLGSFAISNSGPPAFLSVQGSYSTAEPPPSLARLGFVSPRDIAIRTEREATPPICSIVL